MLAEGHVQSAARRRRSGRQVCVNKTCIVELYQLMMKYFAAVGRYLSPLASDVLNYLHH